MVYAVLFFDKVRIDDPVGALSVHLVNGMFGTLAVVQGQRDYLRQLASEIDFAKLRRREN